ncbi:MAG: hypothetical protein V3T41_05290 [bacterium]
MVTQKVIRFTVRTTPDNAESDVQAMATQKFKEDLPEILGPVAAPLAPVLGEIFGQKAGKASKGWLTGRNCFLLASCDLEDANMKEAYDKLLDTPGERYTKDIITWTGDFAPGLIKERVLSYYEQIGVKPEDIKKCNRIGIFVHGYAGEPAVASRILGGPVYADEIFDAVELFIEPGGELWLFVCGGEQETWDEVVAKSKRSFRVIVWPGGGGECIFERDMEPYIGPMLGR